MEYVIMEQVYVIVMMVILDYIVNKRDVQMIALEMEYVQMKAFVCVTLDTLVLIVQLKHASTIVIV
jgi:hypothetical protein